MTFVRPELDGGGWASPGPSAASVVDLDDAPALDAALVGAKAAALARARASGFTTLPGFVITTTAAAALGTAPESMPTEVRQAWEQLSDQGRRSLVVRSSSTVEDGGTSSMAGLFRSVLDVCGFEAFQAAVADVVASGQDQPIGVLVQPYLEPEWGGVLFGADPVTGRRDRLVVAAVPGGPDRLVSGQVDGVQLTLSARGRLIDHTGEVPQPLRRAAGRRQLVRLAQKAATEFGGPQDIEWALTRDSRLVLLQSRPITTLGTEVSATGPMFGPGPVAETFSAPLAPLEEELWVPPLRDALRHTLTTTGSARPRQLRESPLVITVQGRVAADLDVLGLAPRRRRLLGRLDPRPPMRRLRAAWRVGRLRAALPALALDVIRDVDDDLTSVPSLEDLRPDELMRILRRSRDVLTTLHGYEVFAGQLLEPGDASVTAASVALRVIAEAGPDADPDDLVAREPVVLSLSPPAIRATALVPPAPALAMAPDVAPDFELIVREALRLRVRWTQELTARVALALGDELVRRGVLADAVNIRYFRLDDIAGLLAGGQQALAAAAVDDAAVAPASSPLPAMFRLSDDGVVVPVTAVGAGDARGAGGGRGSGPVFHRPGTGSGPPGMTEIPPAGAVLVVRSLDPELAGMLPGLGGLVAETGSVLSHLAILAREYGVPTVVGVAGAVERFTPGQWVVVDGDTGMVCEVDSKEWSAA